MHKSDALSQLRKLRMEIIKSMNGDDIILPTFEELKREFMPESLDKYNRIPTYEELMHKFGPQTEIVPPIDLEGMVARTLVFNFGIDVSHSNSRPIHHEAISKQLNEIINKGMKGYYAENKHCLNMFIGGTIFSDKITLIWDGFQPIKFIKNNPFNMNLLNRSKPDDKLTLCEKIILLVKQTHDVIEKTKKYDQDRAAGVTGKILIVTDRVNDLGILGDKQIYSLMDTFAPANRNGRRSIEVIVAYILTEDTVNEKTHQIAKEVGIQLLDFNYWNGLEGRSCYYWIDSLQIFHLFQHGM